MPATYTQKRKHLFFLYEIKKIQSELMAGHMSMHQFDPQMLSCITFITTNDDYMHTYVLCTNIPVCMPSRGPSLNNFFAVYVN